MEFTASLEFDAVTTVVAEMFATREFVLAKIRLSGATSGDADVLGTSAGAFTVTSRRTMPTTDIPSSYRSLIGQSLEIRQVEAWEQNGRDGARRGTLALEITGAPVRVTGTMLLTPASAGRSIQRLSGDVRASIPLFGKAIEKAVAESVHRAVDVERRAAAEWLRAHA